MESFHYEPKTARKRAKQASQVLISFSIYKEYSKYFICYCLSIPFYQRVGLSTPTTSNTQANTTQENVAGERLLVPNSEFYTDIVYISRVQATKTEHMIPVGIHTLFYYMGFIL